MLSPATTESKAVRPSAAEAQIWLRFQGNPNTALRACRSLSEGREGGWQDRRWLYVCLMHVLYPDCGILHLTVSFCVCVCVCVRLAVYLFAPLYTTHVDAPLPPNPPHAGAHTIHTHTPRPTQNPCLDDTRRSEPRLHGILRRAPVV